MLMYICIYVCKQCQLGKKHEFEGEQGRELEGDGLKGRKDKEKYCN